MKYGLWVWPTDPRAQRKVLAEMAQSTQLMSALTALAKSKDGLSNSGLDDAIEDNSEWMTLTAIKQLTALGFIEMKVDFFGGPVNYHLTDLGRNAYSFLTGQKLPPKLQAPPPPPPAPPQAPPAQAPAQAQPAKPAAPKA